MAQNSIKLVNFTLLSIESMDQFFRVVHEYTERKSMKHFTTECTFLSAFQFEAGICNSTPYLNVKAFPVRNCNQSMTKKRRPLKSQFENDAQRARLVYGRQNPAVIDAYSQQSHNDKNF